MSGRGSLNDLWGNEDEEEGSLIDDYERLQRAQTQTIANLVPQQQAIVPAPAPSRGRGGQQAQAPAPPQPTVSLWERYRADYNRAMDARRDEWDDDEEAEARLSDSESEPDGPDEVDEEGDDNTSSSASPAGAMRPRPGARRAPSESADEASTDSPSTDDEARERAERREHRRARERQERREHPSEARGYDVGGGDRLCFLCSFGSKRHDKLKHEHVAYLRALLKETYGSHSNAAVARAMHQYFREEIWRPGCGLPMLTTAMALEHIEGLHTLNARVFLGEMIRDEKMMYLTLKNAVWRQDGSFDKNVYKAYNESKKELRQLYTTPLARMNFADDEQPEDQRRAADYFQMMARFGPQDQAQRQRGDQRRRLNTPFRL